MIWLDGVQTPAYRHHAVPRAVRLEALPPIPDQTLWSVVPGGIYLVPADSPRSIHYFDFSTKKIRKIFEAPKGFGYALSVSPDGRWLLYAQQDEENTDIMLVENFG